MDLSGNPQQPDIVPGQIWEHDKHKSRYRVETSPGSKMHKGRDGVWRESVEYRSYPLIDPPHPRRSTVWSRDVDMFRADFSYIEGP